MYLYTGWHRSHGSVMARDGEVLAAAAHFLLDVFGFGVDYGLRRRGVLRLPVPPKVHLSLEGLVAEAAGEGLVARVLAHVGDEVGRLAEGFGADDALVGFLAWNKGNIDKDISRLL